MKIKECEECGVKSSSPHPRAFWYTLNRGLPNPIQLCFRCFWNHPDTYPLRRVNHPDMYDEADKVRQDLNDEMNKVIE